VDADGDGTLEAIVVQGGGKILSLRLSDGAIVAGPGMAPDGALRGAAAGDLDADGMPEVAIPTTAGVYAYESTCVMANDLCAVFRREVGRDVFPSPPLIGDVDGDGSAESIAYIPGRGVAALGRGGKISPDWNFSVGDKVTVAPVLYDLEGDGALELLALSEDGFLYAWRTAGRTLATSMPWPQHRADACHQGVLRAASAPQPKQGRLFVNRSVYCYPNPSEGERVFLRYQLVEPVDRVEIRVYDLLGELIAEIPGSRHTMGDNEVEWCLNEVQAGVYLGRVEARKGERRQVEFVRIAVVK
jgi:hypothetical protein